MNQNIIYIFVSLTLDGQFSFSNVILVYSRSFPITFIAIGIPTPIELSQNGKRWSPNPKSTFAMTNSDQKFAISHIEDLRDMRNS